MTSRSAEELAASSSKARERADPRLRRHRHRSERDNRALSDAPELAARVTTVYDEIEAAGSGKQPARAQLLVLGAGRVRARLFARGHRLGRGPDRRARERAVRCARATIERQARGRRPRRGHRSPAASVGRAGDRRSTAVSARCSGRDRAAEAGVTKPRRPTKEQVAAAYGKRVADVIAPSLDVLFCGINPGSIRVRRAPLRSSRQQVLAGAPSLVSRTACWRRTRNGSCSSGALADQPRRARTPPRKPESWRRTSSVAGVGVSCASCTRSDRLPRGAGVTAYRIAFGELAAGVGPQDRVVGSTRLWVLPTPAD